MLTSLYEGSPNVLLEALNSECYLVCTPFESGAKDIITTDCVGLITKDWSEATVANTLRSVIKDRKKPDVTDLIGILEHYSPKNFVYEIDELFCIKR